MSNKFDYNNQNIDGAVYFFQTLYDVLTKSNTIL